MFGLGGQEIILILLVVGLLFGAKHLPELGKSFGSAIREFKKEIGGAGAEETAAGGSEKSDEKQ